MARRAPAKRRSGDATAGGRREQHLRRRPARRIVGRRARTRAIGHATPSRRAHGCRTADVVLAARAPLARGVGRRPEPSPAGRSRHSRAQGREPRSVSARVRSGHPGGPGCGGRRRDDAQPDLRTRQRASSQRHASARRRAAGRDPRRGLSQHRGARRITRPRSFDTPSQQTVQAAERARSPSPLRAESKQSPGIGTIPGIAGDDNDRHHRAEGAASNDGSHEHGGVTGIIRAV
jgi:hypothetical protein